MQIDENDELACWAIICRQPYKDRMGEGVKYIVHKYWLHMFELHQIQGM